MSLLGAIGAAVFRSLTRPEDNAHKVLEVKQENYSSLVVVNRHDSLVLYGTRDGKYEVVLHLPVSVTLYKAFSLLRTSDGNEAISRFSLFKEVIPVLIETNQDLAVVAEVQRICDLLVEHPTWSAAHVAAHFGYHLCLMHPLLSSSITVIEPQNGMSPLMVAILTGNLKTVQQLLGFGPVVSTCLEQRDNNGNSVFHHAASTTKEIIAALASVASSSPGGKSASLNVRNGMGHTPLHVACLSDKPNCVRALLAAGADVNITATRVSTDSNSFSCSTPSPPGNLSDYLHQFTNKLYSQDMKLGGTPLHWACSRQVIEVLLDVGCEKNALNFEGQTALHVMVMRERLDCVVSLLSHMAAINIGDNNGNRPLHLAALQGNTQMIEALVIFGADLNIKNNAGVTPRHLVATTDHPSPNALYALHAVGAARCPPGMNFPCQEGCSHNGTFDGLAPDPPPRNPLSGKSETEELIDQMLRCTERIGWNVDAAAGDDESYKGGNVLCLDGGGVRGLVLICILMELETALGGKPIQHVFDWVSGTSTGGILALGLATGKSLLECMGMYFKLKDQAMTGSRPYPSEPLENILKETLGANTVMADIRHPRLTITSVLGDRKPAELFMFRNYDSPASVMGTGESACKKFKSSCPHLSEAMTGPEMQLLWKVARATGAAPSYFKQFGCFLDGGLISNNPTLDTLTEIHRRNVALNAMGRKNEMFKPVTVVSVGTGMPPISPVKEIDIFRPGNILDSTRLLAGLSVLGNLLIDQATACDSHVVDRARAWCSTMGVNYYRFSPPLSSDIQMNETRDDTLVHMLWETKVYMRHQTFDVQQLANKLLHLPTHSHMAKV
ncbi:85/88 kDa calcium-independent phospholipase A2-like [Ischnura elegans]|uniref:85/88 kDa calcium-independent phospholipase A2-like n=1 Tax=Ischnura elegans TaxID=197161 RepID=UPI001ED8A344|nr:85/88 kDa calcium-independent phospholipase A2-like [Ischnura elegans]